MAAAVTRKSAGEAYGVGGRASMGARPQLWILVPQEKGIAMNFNACRAKKETHTSERKQDDTGDGKEKIHLLLSS